MSHPNYHSSSPGPHTAGASAPRGATPGCPHDYPVAITEAGLSSALQVAKKTMGYAWLRYVESVFLSAITLVVLTVVLGASVALYMYVHKYVGGAALIAGALALIFWVLPFIETQTFLSRCGHIAVITRLVTRGEVGNGQQKMFKYGRDIAIQSLGELDTIRQVHSALRRAFHRLIRTLNFIDRWLPIDLSVVKRIVYRVFNWVMPYIDAVVLSYGMARGDKDFAHAGIDGLCYSLQNAKTIIKTAVGAFLLEKALLAPLWLGAALGFGVAAVMGVLHFTGADVTLLSNDPRAFFQAEPFVGLGALAAGLVLGSLVAHLIVKSVSESFVRPMLITLLLIKFHVTVRNQPLDGALQSRILEANDGFGHLADVAGHVRMAT